MTDHPAMMWTISAPAYEMNLSQIFLAQAEMGSPPPMPGGGIGSFLVPFVLLFLMTPCGLIGAIIGQRKGRAGAGFVLGALLGPIGWLVVGVGPNYKEARDSKKCPFCAELIKKEARVCRHCGRDLPAPTSAESR
jgi:hypothetical protein